MNYIAIIPARYASTRFPGKPLAMLGDKTVIRRVYEQVTKCISDTYVATDDERIYDHVLSWGGKVVMTRSDHKSGTDRIEEAMEKIEATGKHFDVVVNIQGDEPFIQPTQIESVCKCFDDPATEIATLGIKFGNNWQAVQNPNSPKIAVDNKGFAMYFSRSVIPYCRGKEQETWADNFPYLKHIGMYAYRREVLREVTRLPQSSLELAESLEQLRWLQNGYKIKVGETQYETIGIDTPEDLEKANALINSK
ncbi:MAG: 3-deoxy-manno-octulosonate cytidylyltransferase [Prevotella sp.]|nr:3-deoxy-manno-octulosonate cytidylyltransferase [Prevotella sp.]